MKPERMGLLHLSVRGLAPRLVVLIACSGPRAPRSTPAPPLPPTPARRPRPTPSAEKLENRGSREVVLEGEHARGSLWNFVSRVQF